MATKSIKKVATLSGLLGGLMKIQPKRTIFSLKLLTIFIP